MLKKQLNNLGPNLYETITSYTSEKIWVSVTTTNIIRVSQRKKTDMSDSGGVFVTLYGSKSISSIQPISIPKKGRWAPTHEITVDGVHHMDNSRIVPGYTMPLSKALGPFHYSIILPHIHNNPEKTFIAPAYPTKEGDAIADTQICVSGKVEQFEKPIDAAKREIKEELGMESIEITEIIPHGKPVIINRTLHHLFFASV